MFALVDCNNFYASCQRVFEPHLIGKPVVILSNNDGCVIARSNEAKALGIPMGAPAFEFKKIFDECGANVNVASYHPGAVPEMKGQAYIGEGYADEASIKTLLELGEKARGSAFTLPANLLGPVCDMCSAVTAITYAGILAYRDTVTQILGAPAGFAQMMANEALTQVTALMQDEGIDKMDEALNPGALLGTADSMNFGPLAEIVPTVLENLEKRS